MTNPDLAQLHKSRSTTCLVLALEAAAASQQVHACQESSLTPSFPCAQYFGADSASKPHNPYSGGSLSKTASYDGGIGRYSAKLEASNLDRGLSNAGLYATPHRTHSARCGFCALREPDQAAGHDPYQWSPGQLRWLHLRPDKAPRGMQDLSMPVSRFVSHGWLPLPATLAQVSLPNAHAHRSQPVMWHHCCKLYKDLKAMSSPCLNRSARSATSTRSGAAAAAPLRTGGSATSAGSGRRLQMARPNRSVLNTEAPPQVHSSPADELPTFLPLIASDWNWSRMPAGMPSALPVCAMGRPAASLPCHITCVPNIWRCCCHARRSGAGRCTSTRHPSWHTSRSRQGNMTVTL